MTSKVEAHTIEKQIQQGAQHTTDASFLILLYAHFLLLSRLIPKYLNYGMNSSLLLDSS